MYINAWGLRMTIAVMVQGARRGDSDLLMCLIIL